PALARSGQRPMFDATPPRRKVTWAPTLQSVTDSAQDDEVGNYHDSAPDERRSPQPGVPCPVVRGGPISPRRPSDDGGVVHRGVRPHGFGVMGSRGVRADLPARSRGWSRTLPDSRQTAPENRAR